MEKLDRREREMVEIINSNRMYVLNIENIRSYYQKGVREWKERHIWNRKREK